MAGKERKIVFPLLPRVTGGTESVLPVPAGPSGQSERWCEKVKAEQSKHRWDRLPEARPNFSLRCPGSWGSDSGLSY